MTGRNVTAAAVGATTTQTPHPTPLDDGMEGPWRLYSLCPCENCSGTGKKIEVGTFASAMDAKLKRCPNCRGEGRTLALKATATDPQSVGVALCTLAEEGEWDGDCPFGLMYRPEGQKGRWLLKPWQASTRNVSDAAKLLRAQR